MEKRSMAGIPSQEPNSPFTALAAACVAKDWPKAIKLISSLIPHKPDYLVPLLCNRAFCHLQLDLYKHALKDCDKALSLNPLAFRAYLYKGHALAGLGKCRDSLPTWKQGYEAIVNHCGCVELLQELHTLVLNLQEESSEANVTGTTGVGLFDVPNLEHSASSHKTKSNLSVCRTDMEIASSPTKEVFEISSGQPSLLVSGLPQKAPLITSVNKNDHTRNAHSISLDLRLSRGITQVNARKYDEAIKIFDQILKDGQESVEALLGRGTALAFKGNLEAAIVDFSKAIQVNPQTGEAWKRRGQANAALGLTAEAITDLTRALEFEPNSASILYERGVIFFKAKNFESAVKDLEACQALDNSNKFTLNCLGLSLFSIGRHTEAIQTHKKAINIDQTFKESWAQLAQSYKELGESNEAIRCSRKAIELDERYVSAYRLLGSVLHGLGDHRTALKEVSAALEFDPSNLDCKYLQASCLHALGEYKKAVKSYESILDAVVDNTDSCTLQNLAYYQREIALYTASKVTAPFSCFDIDGDLNPVWKEAWCKKVRPTVDIALLSSHPSVELSLKNGRLKPQGMLMTKSKKLLLEVADQIGSKIQYKCPGFLINRRQHRMAGLAAIEIAQKVLNTWNTMKNSWVLSDDRVVAKAGKKSAKRESLTTISQNRGGVCSSSDTSSEYLYSCHADKSSSLTVLLNWQDVYSIAVKWRQVSEPCDPVVWVNKLSEKEFNVGFGSYTPMLLGQAHVVRYYPNFSRSFSLLKKLILEKKSVHKADDRVLDLTHDNQLETIMTAESCSELHDVVGDDFWIVTSCCSTAFEGKILDGTRLTVQKRQTGYEFSIRTPGTPPRWADYDLEMSAAWEALCETYYGDYCGSSDLEQQSQKMLDSILRLTFYWYNFMPLARGTAAVGYIVLLGLFLAAGLEVGASIPQGLQVDWEAILSPDLNSFKQAVSPWMYPSLKENTTWQILPDVSSTFQSTAAVIAALSTYD